MGNSDCYSALQSAAVDLAVSASKAARNEEPNSPENAMGAANMELAAYTSGTLAYLAQGQDFEAINLAEHVSFQNSSQTAYIVKWFSLSWLEQP